MTARDKKRSVPRAAEGRPPPGGAHPSGDPATLQVDGGPALPQVVRRFRLTVVQGAGAGASWESTSDACSIGAHPSNDLLIDDPTVSRFHCEVKVAEGSARLRDLESRNGTIVDGVRVADAFLRDGSLIQIGRSTVRFDLGAAQNRLPISERTEFGPLVSRSIAMRTSFALMERAAAADATVLIEGETGTGKSLAARAIHEASARSGRPFIVVDCGAIAETILESELFGHEKGAFTGALQRRVGAFQEADGGTVFLDEIGELPTDLQPKLLRVLEERVVRPIGTNTFMPVDVRLIAATNRDLRAEVNAARFRSDLYFRLAVVRIAMPALRQRPEDIPVVVERILQSLRAREEQAAALRTPEFLASLMRSAWPGNLRELRNHIERCLVLHDALPTVEEEAPGSSPREIDPTIAYPEARRRALDSFERAYLAALLRHHEGKVTEAASAADIDRVYLYKLLRRHGIKP